MGELRMPSLGADMEAATLVEWKVGIGDVVHHGDIVADVETEKGLIAIEVFEDGVVERILVAEGTEVPVGTPLALIAAAAATPAVERPAKPGPQLDAAQHPPTPPADYDRDRRQAPPPRAPAAERQRVSPLARRRAAELGLDLASISGSGEGGAITAADLERAAPAARPQSAPRVSPTTDATAAMRRAIAAAMSRSKHEIPHYYLATTIDMGRALAWLDIENRRRSITNRLLYSVLLVRAVALALREVPEMNGHWIDESFHPGSGIHVGVAISLRSGGLMAPAIHNTDQLSIEALSTSLLDLVKRARSGGVRGSEITDATITVTNLGEQGVENVFGVIYPPQVALVGFGRIVQQPRAVEGEVAIRPVITATLAADHRASDGLRGGRLLTAIDRLLQQPAHL